MCNGPVAVSNVMVTTIIVSIVHEQETCTQNTSPTGVIVSNNEQSQMFIDGHSSGSTPSSPSLAAGSPQPTASCPRVGVHMQREINILKAQVHQLRMEVSTLYRHPAVPSNTDKCDIYVRVDSQLPKPLKRSILADLLRCKILHYKIVRGKLPMVFRVTIPKSDLFQALSVSHHDKYVYVQLWKPKPQQYKPTSPSNDSLLSNLRVATWNCRGLRTGEPYLHHLLTNLW